MANYKSNYTGAKIDSAVNKANSIPIIPQPTSENVGKVLGVVEGAGRDDDPEYGLVPMGGGNEDFVVTFSGRTTNQSDTATCDKTGNEILTAIAEGKNIRFRYCLTNGYSDIYYDLVLKYDYSKEPAQLSNIEGTYTVFAMNEFNITQVPAVAFSVYCGWDYQLNRCYCVYYADWK